MRMARPRNLYHVMINAFATAELGERCTSTCMNIITLIIINIVSAAAPTYTSVIHFVDQVEK